jgi:GntR family transcriptional regulator
MSNRPTTARQLRELLVHRIASGQYPIGAQLPGTREFAVEIGANRNTVAKVYGELAREGLLQIVPGRGAFVVGRLDPTTGQEPTEQVIRALDDAVSRARLFGLSREAVLRLAEERIRSLYEDGTPRMAFLECNPYDAQLVASELTTQLGAEVVPRLIAEIPSAGSTGFDVATTSLFHLEEVERLLTPRGVQVIGVHTLPDPEALRSLARLTAGTRVGVIAANDAGVNRFNMLVRTYSQAQTRTLVTPSDEALDDLMPWSDVLVTSLSCAVQVRSRAGDRPVIVLAFHLDPQSAQYIRSDVLAAAT